MRRRTKNYNRIQTERRGCGWGKYSGDGNKMVGMGTKYITMSSSKLHQTGKTQGI